MFKKYKIKKKIINLSTALNRNSGTQNLQPYSD